MSYSWGANRGTTGVSGRALGRAAAVPALRPDGPAPALPEPDGPVFEQQRVADELAPMVEVWTRLLAQHVPDQAGCCRTCTKGGTGLSTTPWPCVIHGIADMARRSYNAERRRAAS
jgi:hypothetical protein